MIFHNGGDDLYFITSGDFMTRNMERRVEVSCPIFDPDLKQEIRDIFDIQWNDNVKARILDRNLTNRYVVNSEPTIRAQNDIYNYLAKKHASKEG
jgi:polyphosphate kinase